MFGCSSMEWLRVPPLVHDTFATLGSARGETYEVNEGCLETLEEIHSKLATEDHTLRTYRRAICFGQNIQNDLIPLLINIKDSKIQDLVIKLLVNLTTPVECLLSIEVMSKTAIGRHTIYELSNLLTQSKKCFADSRTTKAVIDYLKNILERDNIANVECDSINNCLLLLRNVLHIPENKSINCNIISSLQNQIVWNLFTQSIDKLLIYLISSEQRSFWGLTMVQLIALMYKDQHVGTLHKLLNSWFEASLSESSDDNESNTYPPNKGSGDSSSMLTSDRTSDSSDNGGIIQEPRADKLEAPYSSPPATESSNSQHENKTIDMATIAKYSTSRLNNSTSIKSEDVPYFKSKIPEYPSRKNSSGNIKQRNQDYEMSHQTLKRESDVCPSTSEMSDCGYGTQLETQESFSASSNEDEVATNRVHRKPPVGQKLRFNTKNRNAVSSHQDIKEWRRKKLVKRSKTNIINMKGLMHHTPTDVDISNILKEFTVDFLLKGYGNLVQQLHNQLLSGIDVLIDTSHFFWLLTYFLKFATQLELDLEHVNQVLTFNIISYLTYEGVSMCEQIALNSTQNYSDLKPCIRRLHLVVTAIREFLQAVDTYKHISHLSNDDRAYLLDLQLKIGGTENLKCLFVLLLRKYDPAIQSKQYLQDIIITNHTLLSLLDTVSKLPDYKGTGNMVDHIKQFASVEVMYQYGLLLQDFRDNGEFVNDCIFTMMHHVGGDLQHESSLFQPVIVKAFSQIWETEYELCSDWSDLIEYVIHKCINIPQLPDKESTSSSLILKTLSTPTTPLKHVMDHRWTQNQSNSLYWYFVKSAEYRDQIGQTLKLFCENYGKVGVDRIGIIQQILRLEIIDHMKYDNLMKQENVTDDLAIIQGESEGARSVSVESGFEIRNCKNDESDDVRVLTDKLAREGKGHLMMWLQRILLEACYVKLNLQAECRASDKVMEPIPYHYIMMKQSIPVVPWNSEQYNILLHQPFILLLYKLGFHLPADAGKLFLRIPEFWTADIMFSVAQKLGPIDTSTLKFNTTDLSFYAEMSISTPVETAGGSEFYQQFAMTRPSHAHNIIRYTPNPNITEIHQNQDMENNMVSEAENNLDYCPMWTNFERSFTENNEGIHPSNQAGCSTDMTFKCWIDLDSKAKDYEECLSETASVASDLTRMYVSDEEDIRQD